MPAAWMERMAFTREHRIGVWMLCADLLDSGMEVERALPAVAAVQRAAGKRSVALVLQGLLPALETGRMQSAVARVTPGSEAMVFAGFGRVEAATVFRAAARIAQVEDRVMLALRTHLVGPVALVATILLMLFGAGEWFVPAMQEMAPLQEWPAESRIAGELAVAFTEHVVWIGGALAAVGMLVWWLARHWVGPGRAVADGFFPFSLVRLVTGLSFVLTVVEAMRAGLDLDRRLFEALEAMGMRYTRHRIRAIREAMEGGLNLGAAMGATGHGFPAPELIPVITALEGMESWEERLGKFVDRWVARSERHVAERAAVVNRVLTMVVVVIAGSGMWLFFGMLPALMEGLA